MSGPLGKCDKGSKLHPQAPSCLDWKAVAPTPPTEMTSLKAIRDKLDTLAESQDKLFAALNELSLLLKGNESMAGIAGKVDNLFALHAVKLADLAESQGKLLAALDEVVEACKANGDGLSFVRGEIGQLDAKMMATGNGLADELRDMRESAMRNFQSLRYEISRKRYIGPRPKRRKK